MIEPLDAYRLLNICKLHFTTEKFDCTKTKSIKNLSQRYEKLSDAEKRFYRVACKNFTKPQEYCKMLIAVFLNGSDPRYIPFTDCMSYYNQYVARKESLKYRLELEATQFMDERNKLKLLHEYMRGLVSPEYILLLDYREEFLDKMESDYQYIGYKEVILALRKFRSFFNASKYISVLETVS